MLSCLFCKIVAGEIPSTRVYEDHVCIAFLDINPVNKGHVLIVPKEHTENFLVTPEETISAVMPVVQRVAKAILKATGAEGFNLHVNNGHVSGQEVDHLHIHIIPRFPTDGLKHWPKIEYEEGQMQAVGEAIRKQLM